jgi:hypothetical protein
MMMEEALGLADEKDDGNRDTPTASATDPASSTSADNDAASDYHRVPGLNTPPPPWSLFALPMPHPLVLTLFTILTAHLVTVSLASKLLIEVPLMIASYKMGKFYMDYFEDLNELMARWFPNIKRLKTKPIEKMPWQQVAPLFAAEWFDFFKTQLHTRALLYSGVLTNTLVVSLFVGVSILQSLALLNGVIKRTRLRIEAAEKMKESVFLRRQMRMPKK